ncbi:MAG TPA: carboxylesterase family protein [Steroidobacteraceae bacterium]|nr:carboxylesterase family protein [Steroidobacteraceae bacterium]
MTICKCGPSTAGTSAGARIRFGVPLWPVVLIAFAICWCGVAAGALAINTDRGWVQGTQEGDLTVYKGLPFAAPPVGGLRWRAPQPVKAWPGVKLLDHFSPRCMQHRMYPDNAPAEPLSEDCLYLNLWVPPHSSEKKLAVMVWIYGGGLDGGSGSIPLYAGDVLAQHGVIVVTLNYRLGVFGFLAHPELARESATHTTGNYGLLDQLAALRWVHRNIAAFGGDPSRVTIFGQSSGSISLSALSVSPLTKGLFKYAIGESGGLFEPMNLLPELTEKGAEQDGLAFAARAGASSMAALRRMPAEALMKVPFTPAIIIDGSVIDEIPVQAYRRARITPLAFMIGSNQDEGVIFLSGKKVTPKTSDKVLSNDFPSWLIKLTAPSPGNTPATAYAAAKDFEGDLRFHWDMWTWARMASRTGRPVYLYRFDHPTPCTPTEGCTEATRHGDEMPYVFGHDLKGSWSTQDRRLSQTMVECWTHFAKTGTPNGCGLPDWPSYRTQSAVMVIGDHPHLAPMQADATMERLDHVYRWISAIAGHPIIATVIVLAIVIAGIWLLIMLVRSLIAQTPAAEKPNSLKRK